MAPTAIAACRDGEDPWLTDPRTGEIAVCTHPDATIGGGSPIDPLPSRFWHEDMADCVPQVNASTGLEWTRRTAEAGGDVVPSGGGREHVEFQVEVATHHAS